MGRSQMTTLVGKNLLIPKRSCDGCTKCCEGYLEGVSYDYSFYPGRPCQFVKIGVGCSIYSQRPKDPCVDYKCSWILEENFPEWMKPNLVDVIVTKNLINNIPYLNAVEAGSVMSSKVLSWIINYCIARHINLRYQVENGINLLGSPEFLAAIESAPNIKKEEK